MTDSDTDSEHKTYLTIGEDPVRPQLPPKELQEVVKSDSKQELNKDEARDEEKITRNMRIRYWNSWEEMRLVELWRRYSDEVITLQKPLPVFRKIMDGMREYGFSVNAQECRRKINTLRKKYISERRNLEVSHSSERSEWRLYPLIHCLLAPKVQNPDLMHEAKIVNKLLAKLPKTEESTQPTVPLMPISTTRRRKPLQPRLQQTNGSQAPSDVPPPPNVSSCDPVPSLPLPLPRNERRYSTAGQILPFHRITWKLIEELRADNHRLALQRDEALKRLRLEEEKFKNLETFITHWTDQQQQVLQKVQGFVTTKSLPADGGSQNAGLSATV